MILETIAAASIYSAAVEPKGLLPPNFLDLNPNAASQSIWQSVTGTYEVGEYQRLKRLGFQGIWNEGGSYEGLRISIKKDRIFFKSNKLDAWAGAKYLGSVFHKPYFGWCGAGGCNRGIGSHSLVYKLSQAVGENRYIDPLKYIIIAFDREKQNYTRVFLSSLTGKERGEGNVTFNFDLDDLEQNNIQTANTKPIKVQVFAQDFFQLKPIKHDTRHTNFLRYRMAAFSKHLAQKLATATDNHEGKDLTKPAENLEVASIRKFNVGRMFERGDGVTVDIFKAYRWYLRAAEDGLPEAQNEVGVHHYWGLSVPENVERSAHWFKKAAAQGFSEAMFNLGNVYYDRKDNILSQMWYILAETNGDSFAGAFQASFEDPTEIELAKRAARRCALQVYKNCESLAQ